VQGQQQEQLQELLAELVEWAFELVLLVFELER
jgi:hypothetical protein